MDVVREVTTQSWGSRLLDSIKGVLFGLGLAAVAVVLLFWNEGRAVRKAKSLTEGAKAVVHADAAAVNPALEGKLVHVQGRAVTADTVQDPLLGVAAPATLRLARKVEVYQWRQKESKKTEKKMGGGTETVTTYTYEKGWGDQLEASSGFKSPEGHTNPASLPFAAADWAAGRATLGAYALTAAQVRMIGGDVPVTPAAETTTKAAAAAGGRPASISGNTLYIGANPAQPEVGDLRVTFAATPPTEVSVVARQTGTSFDPYPTHAGVPVFLLRNGLVGADEMFKAAQAANVAMTWFLRAAGFVLMLIGLALILSPLSVVADVVPFLGSLVGAGTFLAALVMAAVGSLVVIAVAWITYRPLLGILILAGAAGVFILGLGMKKKKTPPAAAPVTVT